jgi:hypothetical protein
MAHQDPLPVPIRNTDEAGAGFGILRIVMAWLLVCGACGAARAEESLEYLMVMSDSAAVVRVPSFSWGDPREVIVETVEVLKGPVVERLDSSGEHGWLRSIQLPVRDGMSTALLMVRKPRRDRAGRIVEEGFNRVIPLDGSAVVYTIRMEAPREPLLITRAAREAGRATVKEPLEWLAVMKPPIFELRPLDLGREPVLIVPVYEGTEKAAVELMGRRDGRMIEAGLTMLEPFKTPANVERVKGLLTHPLCSAPVEAQSWPNRLDRIQTVAYPVRQWAHKLLKEKWRLDVGTAELETGWEPYRRVSWAWVVFPALGLLLAFAVAAAWRKRRRVMVLAVMGPLAVVTGFQWARSGYLESRAAIPTPIGEFELSSRDGKFRLLHVGDRPGRYQMLAFEEVTGKLRREDPWMNGMVFGLIRVAGTKSRAGFGFAHGSVRVSDSSAYEYRLIEAPGWVVAAGLGVWPVVVWLQWVAGRVRSRRRARANRCHACGYDLRGSSGSCPECGVARLT